MVVKNRDVFEARNALQELVRLDLPVRTSLQVATLVRKLNEVLKDIDVVRKRLIDQYGEDGKRGKQVLPDSDNFPAFDKEFNELLDLDVEVVVEKVTLPEKVVTTCSKCGTSASQPIMIQPWILASLYKFIEVGG